MFTERNTDQEKDAMNPTSTITRHDVADCLTDDRHLGFGLAESHLLTSRKRDQLFTAIAAVAVELGITKEELFHWTNSKWGRWLIDGVYGCDEPINRATVRRCMDAQKVAEVQE